MQVNDSSVRNSSPAAAAASARISNSFNRLQHAIVISIKLFIYSYGKHAGLARPALKHGYVYGFLDTSSGVVHSFAYLSIQSHQSVFCVYSGFNSRIAVAEFTSYNRFKKQTKIEHLLPSLDEL
jgi:hypothetical protein